MAEIKSADEMKEKGNVFFKEGDYDNALACYTKGIKLSKCNDLLKATLYKNRAACYLKEGDYENTVKDCTEALEITPGDAKSLFRRCQAYEHMGKINEAYKDALEWFKVDPKNKSAQPILTRLYAQFQDLVKQQAGTQNRVTQMFELVFGNSPDKEKRVQAANNLLVLAKEKAGAELMLKEGLLSKLVTLFKKDSQAEVILAGIRVIGELCKKNIVNTKTVLETVGIDLMIDLMKIKSEEHVTAVQYCIQTMLNTLGGLDLKAETRVDKQIICDMKEANKTELYRIMKAVTQSINRRAMSAVGRDGLLEIIMKNVEITALDWALPFVDVDGVYRILEVASELREYKFESSIDTTDNTRATVTVAIQKVYDALDGDKARDQFREKVDEFVKDKLRGPDIEPKVRVTAAICVMLQGALDLGNYCIAQQGVLEMMLVMAGSEDSLQQMIAAEAIIAAASKKDKCASITSLGTNILKQLYMSKNDNIRVRGLVGLCKIGSVGGTDASIKPFSDESQSKLAAACRRFLINPAKDRDLRKWAAEGLSYLTLHADIKEDLINDRAALQALIELGKAGDMSCLYGVVTTLVNLTNSYDKQEIIPEMLQLAKFAKQHVPVEHEKDNKEYTDKRVKVLAEAGVTIGLVGLSKTEAKNSRELISRVFNAICEHKELRGAIVQQGGAKALIPMALDGTEKGKVAAAQALCRIAITINPEIAFPGQRCLEAVRPMLQLLHVDCSALQNFEALLALCNLASLSPSVRHRIVAEGGISKIENYMYEDHDMLKRAAAQCMLNMLLSEEVIKLHEAKNDRVKYWTLLAVDEDTETALAACGALAILTQASTKCCSKVFQPKDWLDILRALLVNENREIQYRGALIVHNVMASKKSIAEKLIETDIMELLLVVSQMENPECARAREWAVKALKVAEGWKLIKPNEGDADDDDLVD